MLGSGEVSTRGRHEPTMPAPSRNMGITRTIVGLGVALAGSGEVPTQGRHNSSVPTRSDGRGAVLAERGEVPTRGRHNSSVPTRSDGSHIKCHIYSFSCPHCPELGVHSEPQTAHRQPSCSVVCDCRIWHVSPAELRTLLPKSVSRCTSGRRAC